ncbi:MAG: DUF2785 domain-containing protein [Lysobacteraceae bacterium]|nr:MAG: DUF2785 domain-containing protein [Xanthomonadaceae bacterium]
MHRSITVARSRADAAWQRCRRLKRGSRAWISVALLLFLCPMVEVARAACPPASWTRTALQELKERSFAIEDPTARFALAEALIGCLSSPSAELRDGVAYEALQHWMRAGAFGPERLRMLEKRLRTMLDGRDRHGVARPFAALVLAEIARTDRVSPWMTAEERAAMVERAAAYLESVRDYRGFDRDVGWRHGVAHGADWLMQLALNPNIGKPELDRIIRAIAEQAVPRDAHAYVFGESERLARPLLFVAMRGLHEEAEWGAWFEDLRGRLGEPGLAYRDTAWLARRHDLWMLLSALHIEVSRSEGAAIAKLRPALLAALQALP